ncbi:hypothetical protein [Halorussus halophilus]|uniref:hypothetical protein n=1 Tax=Halorussus halophilus TaxID=2650975 RepID=UPI00130183A5|nr:hypothetical protein [Halorussus halophilus]
MFDGKPNTQTDQPAITADEPSEETDGGNNTDETSVLSRAASVARAVSEVVAPFSGLLTSIVQLLTIHQLIRRV